MMLGAGNRETGHNGGTAQTGLKGTSLQGTMIMHRNRMPRSWNLEFGIWNLFFGIWIFWNLGFCYRSLWQGEENKFYENKF